MGFTACLKEKFSELTTITLNNCVIIQYGGDKTGE
jgi:hypothetical protein